MMPEKIILKKYLKIRKGKKNVKNPHILHTLPTFIPHILCTLHILHFCDVLKIYLEFI